MNSKKQVNIYQISILTTQVHNKMVFDFTSEKTNIAITRKKLNTGQKKASKVRNS